MDYVPEIQMTPKNMLTCVEYVLFFSFSSAVVIILENINITESVDSLGFKDSLYINEVSTYACSFSNFQTIKRRILPI